MAPARMHSVFPASGIGGGSIAVGGGDRELLQAVSDNGLLQQMLKKTPAGGGVAISLPSLGNVLRLIGPQAGKSRPPLVRGGSKSLAAQVRALLGDLADGLDMLEVEALESAGAMGTVNGPLTINGFPLQSTCGANTFPHSGLWLGQPSYAAGVCGNGYAGVPFVEALAVALSHVNPLARGGLLQLTTQNNAGGFPVGKRRRYAYQETPAGAGSRGVVHTVMARAGLASRGVTVSTDKRPSKYPRTRGRTLQQLPGYKKPAYEISVSPGKQGEIVIGGPPVRVTHREVPTKTEKKAKWRVALAKIIGGYHAATEINDFFESLADAIPGNPCGGMPGFARALCVIDHSDEIDPRQAAVNLIANELEDRLVGSAMGQLGKLTKAGGPNTVQMTQFLRQIASLTRGVL